MKKFFAVIGNSLEAVSMFGWIIILWLASSIATLFGDAILLLLFIPYWLLEKIVPRLLPQGCWAQEIRKRREWERKLKKGSAG